MISLIIFGFFVGLVARFVLPGKDRMGLIATTLLGILGAFVGGWLGEALGFYTVGQPAGFIMATIGAIVVLVVFNSVSNRKS